MARAAQYCMKSVYSATRTELSVVCVYYEVLFILSPQYRDDMDRQKHLPGSSILQFISNRNRYFLFLISTWKNSNYLKKIKIYHFPRQQDKFKFLNRNILIFISTYYEIWRKVMPRVSCNFLSTDRSVNITQDIIHHTQYGIYQEY